MRGEKDRKTGIPEDRRTGQTCYCLVPVPLAVSAAGRGSLTNKANLDAGETAASNAAGATCRAAGGRRLGKTKPFGDGVARSRRDRVARNADRTQPRGGCGTHRFKLDRLLWNGRPERCPIADFQFPVGPALLTSACCQKTYGFQDRRETLRFFPGLSETFRFVPFCSAPIHPVPRDGSGFRAVPGRGDQAT